ncbi:MAG: TSUP family transporter [Streptosporangiales bacterium]|nr:TSUP family transporter [Streptosporangiales bacterium]
MSDLTVIMLAGLAVLVGAVVQSGVGLGVGLVAAPVVTMLDPTLMPGCVLVTTLTLPIFTLSREAGHADWGGLKWALGGRVFGTMAGVWVVASAPKNLLGLIVGGMVLAAVALTAWKVRIARNPRTLIAAGATSGITGTSTSIGGPPLAILYQHAPGPQVRATLGVYFTVGAVLSLSFLTIAGELTWREVLAGLALVPFTVTGFLISGPLRRFLDQGYTRAGVLVVTAASATTLIIRSLA